MSSANLRSNNRSINDECWGYVVSRQRYVLSKFWLTSEKQCANPHCSESRQRKTRQDHKGIFVVCSDLRPQIQWYITIHRQQDLFWSSVPSIFLIHNMTETPTALQVERLPTDVRYVHLSNLHNIYIYKRKPNGLKSAASRARVWLGEHEETCDGPCGCHIVRKHVIVQQWQYRSKIDQRKIRPFCHHPNVVTTFVVLELMQCLFNVFERQRLFW